LSIPQVCATNVRLGFYLMNDLNLWATTYRQILHSHDDPSEMKFWLEQLSWDRLEALTTGKVIVYLNAPSVFYANFIRDKYKTTIEKEITSLLGKPCEISISVSTKTVEESPKEVVTNSNYNTISNLDNPLAPPSPSDYTNSIETPVVPQKSGNKSFSVLNDFIDPALTFDNYIMGPSNQFAYASAFSTSEKPAVQYNPLFIYGPPGVGKTHLLHAIGNQIKKKNPHIRAYFVSAEKFVNEFIESIQHKNPGDFRAKYRDNIDLLLIDDVQFIVGKDRSEEEFIHTFNTLHGLKKMIVLTSDKAPKDIDGLEDRIRTRFEMGLVADIRPPEIETRIAILKAKAEADDVYLPDEVATFLGTYVKETVRNLHGALVKLQQFASLTGSEITLDLAKQVLQNAIPEEGQEYTVEIIMSAVCKHYNIKLKDLKGTSRAKQFSIPRQISMYLIRRYANLGFREISQIFGKDHSTAVHAYQKIENDIENDPELKRSVEMIREQL
jgi:chromosomal replication initiator protein